MNSDTNAKVASGVQTYAEKVGAVDLIEDLTKLLLVEKPADPLPFLAGHLERKATVTMPTEAGACGTEEEAKAYLEEHKLPQILEELLGRLLFARPDDPSAFLAEQLREAGGSSAAYFTDDDLHGMFSLFDPTGTGSITAAQALAGARSLGLEPADDAAPEGPMDEAAFVSWARERLDAARVL
ncbi:hypothetical protein FNF27_04770 [Cafeteria roenbergensis]|uniref:EF-hand domain-containing protein n=1 Tax=Cafeteria roenbergensis TaxID=33653 RepID=A0A5A8E7N1_CAFRO|nr:hypothetical protein FNF31_02022 [Cafeteria roenbergensis]KAA0173813.1 hypothetical protein FNF27_04770 [Cafeteria roenbergensis]